MKAGVSIKAIAYREGLSSDRIVQLMRLAWLDPDLVEKAASGHQPVRLTSDAIFKSPHIALWREQQTWVDNL